MGKYLRVSRYLIAGITALALCTPLWAQFRSSIEGTVTDSSGAVVSGTELTLTNTETGVSQTAQSNDSGYFRYPALPPGTYKIAATKSGFKSVTQTNVVVLAQEIRTIPIVLQPGQVQETVTVSAEPPAIQLSEVKI